jgi:hypothetical protein
VTARRTVLAPEWCAWIAQNVVRGVATDAIARDLAKNGVPRSLATRAVREISSSPAMHGVAAAHARLRAHELRARLASVHAAAAETKGIERRKKPPAREFFDRYWATSRPVVFTDATRGWKFWTPLTMKRLLGDRVVEITDDRERDPDYDANHRAHAKKTKLGAFVDRVLAAGKTNDFYLVANNRAMERAGFDVLLRRIVVDRTYFDPKRLRGAVSLWLGPRGTVTPLHHDTTNILFHQIHGRKEIALVAPWERAVLEGARGFYAGTTIAKLEKRRTPVHRVVLRAGDALFLPAGWWHEVRSLDVSISLSLLAFRRPNAFDWYTPGHGTSSPR